MNLLLQEASHLCALRVFSMASYNNGYAHGCDSFDQV
jgi:hypothetical protein